MPIASVITPDGQWAHVANANAIAVVDLEKWQVVATLKAGKEPDRRPGPRSP